LILNGNTPPMFVVAIASKSSAPVYVQPGTGLVQL